MKEKRSEDGHVQDKTLETYGTLRRVFKGRWFPGC